MGLPRWLRHSFLTFRLALPWLQVITATRLMFTPIEVGILRTGFVLHEKFWARVLNEISLRRIEKPYTRNSILTKRNAPKIIGFSAASTFGSQFLLILSCHQITDYCLWGENGFLSPFSSIRFAVVKRYLVKRNLRRKVSIHLKCRLLRILLATHIVVKQVTAVWSSLKNS
jgi:hypothetical protein